MIKSITEMKNPWGLNRRKYEDNDEANLFTFRNLTLNLTTKELTNNKNGKSVELTPTQYGLYYYIVNFNIDNNRGPLFKEVHNFLFEHRLDGGPDGFHTTLSFLNDKLEGIQVDFRLNATGGKDAEYIIKNI